MFLASQPASGDVPIPSLAQIARVLVPLAVAVAALACSPDLGDLAGLSSDPPELPPAELEGVRIDGFSGAEREFEVRAARARIEGTPTLAHLEQVQIRFHEARRGAIEVRSDGGRLDLESDDFELTGGVSGTTAEGDRFSAEHLSYERESGLLRSSRPVRVQRAGLRLRADSMELDPATRRVRLSGRVVARLNPEAG